jgi:GTP-binding protein HflX
LTRDDLTDLILLRLDLMASIDVRADGLPGLVRAAHLMPGVDTRSDSQSQTRSSTGHYPAQTAIRPGPRNGEGSESDTPNRSWAFLDSRAPSNLDVDFLELVDSLEEELARSRRISSSRDKRDRAILVSVTVDGIGAAQDSLDELRELARSAGVVVLDSSLQRRHKLDPRYLVGRGKLEELIIASLQLGVDLIIFDRNLTPAQVRAINEATDLKIVDRTQLILDIFAQRANSREGKIQVELAQLKYMLPRLSGSGTEMSRLMGGIGGRGPGETKLEVDRRRVRDRIHHLEQQIDQLRTSRRVQRARRARREVPIISIVGYTNAGKSTLLNTLIESAVLAEDRMFATLDPTSRRLRLPRDREVVINDTVGFIRDLPPDLIAAFRATLEEMESSDMLMHLVDASSPQLQSHISTVEKILEELGLSHIPRLLVFNKSDIVGPGEIEHLRRTFGGVVVSALDRDTLVPLVNRIGDTLDVGVAARAFGYRSAAERKRSAESGADPVR